MADITKTARRVMGVRANKGEYEGTSYDYTRLMVEVPMEQNEFQRGNAEVQMNFGDSRNIVKFDGLVFPCELVLHTESFAKNGTTHTKMVGFDKVGK